MNRLLIKMIKDALLEYDGEYAVPLEGVQLMSDTTLQFTTEGQTHQLASSHGRLK